MLPVPAAIELPHVAPTSGAEVIVKAECVPVGWHHAPDAVPMRNGVQTEVAPAFAVEARVD
jgi:hypothetical protein